MKLQCQDLSAVEIQLWILDPFQAKDIPMDPSIEIKLIKLRNDIEPSFKWHAYKEFWLNSIITERFRVSWTKYELLFIALPSSYLMERVFNVVPQTFSKSRNRWNIVKRRDL